MVHKLGSMQNRNDLMFSKIIPKPPKQVAYKAYGFLNQ